MGETLLLLGASVRAAAFSARRANFSPIAADLFADADLAACCPATKVQDYPAGLEAAAQSAPPGPWLYTGALENHPRLVERIAATRPLYGNPGRVLLAVRDPWQVAEALENEGLHFPAIRRGPPVESLGDGLWVRKPFRSAGGVGIELVRADTAAPLQVGGWGPSRRRRVAARGRRKRDHQGPQSYFQRFVQGAPHSAVYTAAGGRAALIGITQQLVGGRWSGAGGFRYAGSLGPLAVDQRVWETFQRIGDCLAASFRLVGLFGVDAVLADGEVWPLEVNPRYCASIEVLERALAINAVELHVAACRTGRVGLGEPTRVQEYCGKAIVYARTATTVSAEFERFARLLNAQRIWPAIADVPAPGVQIEAGCPATTVLAAGATLSAVRRRLNHQARQVQQMLHPCSRA